MLRPSYFCVFFSLLFPCFLIAFAVFFPCWWHETFTQVSMTSQHHPVRWSNREAGESHRIHSRQSRDNQQGRGGQMAEASVSPQPSFSLCLPDRSSHPPTQKVCSSATCIIYGEMFWLKHRLFLLICAWYLFFLCCACEII